MFQILKRSLGTGIVTTSYPRTPAEVSERARGRPQIDFSHWKDARPSAAVCPTGAISAADNGNTRTAILDLGKCIFCGLCAEVDPAIRMTNQCELAVRKAADLVCGANYHLNPDGSHERMISLLTTETADLASHSTAQAICDQSSLSQRERAGVRESRPNNNDPSDKEYSANQNEFEEMTGQKIKERTQKIFGRSLHIRQVDAGSCNGCEIEIGGLTNPIYDAERFGIHFVASPRHADMLLVTGPVTRNMELALRKTYEAMPAPRLVVAVGACGCSGGIFGRNYATVGGVDAVIPVDVYVPGCPPNPHALLHGILTAIGRAKVSADG